MLVQLGDDLHFTASSITADGRYLLLNGESRWTSNYTIEKRALDLAQLESMVIRPTDETRSATVGLWSIAVGAAVGGAIDATSGDDAVADGLVLGGLVGWLLSRKPTPHIADLRFCGDVAVVMTGSAEALSKIDRVPRGVSAKARREPALTWLPDDSLTADMKVAYAAAHRASPTGVFVAQLAITLLAGGWIGHGSLSVLIQDTPDAAMLLDLFDAFQPGGIILGVAAAACFAFAARRGWARPS